MDDDKRLYLQFLQGVITRMNSNSFTIKGIAIAFAAAMITVSFSIDTQRFISLCMAIVATSGLWLLDAYYLRKERQYRCLFDKAVRNDESLQVYDMDASKENVCFCGTLFSVTEMGIYLPLIVVLGILVVCPYFV